MFDETLLGGAGGVDPTDGGDNKETNDVSDDGKAVDGGEGGDAKDADGGKAVDDAGKDDAGDGGDDAGKDADDKSGDKKTEGDEPKEGEDEVKLTGAPETYEDFTIPDDLPVDEKRLEEFQGLAKELDLSQAGAQKLLEAHVDAIQQVSEAQTEAWAEVQKEWRTATENDPEIGGQKLKATIGHAKTALDAFGDADFVDLTEAYGLGNNPSVMRFLSKVGKAISEDGHVGPSRNQPEKAPLKDRLFPTHTATAD